MVTLAELNFGQTVAAGALNALFTAVLVGVIAGLVVNMYETRTENRRRDAEARHEGQLQSQQLEYQTRAALRETYAQFLVAQRRSRQASVKFAKAGSKSRDRPRLEAEAISAHDDFIGLYHRLNLDASREMWEDARDLRRVLDKMLELAELCKAKECEDLIDDARHARQNLEGSFRSRLGYKPPLQERKNVRRV